MKNFITLLMLSVSFLTFAQRDSGMMNQNNFTPDQQAELQTKKMTLSLDLNATQQNKVLALNKKMAVERSEKMKKFRAIKQSGKTLTSNERFIMQNEMLDLQLKHQAEMKHILSADQYKAWKTMRNQKMSKMMNCQKKSKGKMNMKK